MPYKYTQKLLFKIKIPKNYFEKLFLISQKYIQKLLFLKIIIPLRKIYQKYVSK